MPQPGATTLTPTTNGKKILDYVVGKSGSVAQGSRDMNAPERTLRKAIFSSRPVRMSAVLAERMVAYGIQRSWLNLSV